MSKTGKATLRSRQAVATMKPGARAMRSAERRAVQQLQDELNTAAAFRAAYLDTTTALTLSALHNQPR